MHASLWVRIKRSWQLYVLLVIPVALVVLFQYVPMYGAQIAFRNYNIRDGIWGSEWAGMRWITRFVTNRMFSQTLNNTLILNLYSLAFGFPLSIMLALSLNYVRNQKYKKAIQMVSYAPNFISMVVVVGMMYQFFNPYFGAIGKLLSLLSGQSVDVFLNPASFRHVYVWSGVWQSLGFSSIIYISALSSVSPELHESATIDGANIMARIWHIDLPAILPITIINLIMSTGGLLNSGFEKVLLLQNTLNLQTSEVIDTYAYKIGLASSMPNYSYGAAIGLFKSVVCFILMIIVNQISRRVSETSLW